MSCRRLRLATAMRVDLPSFWRMLPDVSSTSSTATPPMRTSAPGAGTTPIDPGGYSLSEVV